MGFLDLREKIGGWTALHLAAIGGHLDVVYMLMEAGCDPRVKDKVSFLHRTWTSNKDPAQYPICPLPKRIIEWFFFS